MSTYRSIARSSHKSKSGSAFSCAGCRSGPAFGRGMNYRGASWNSSPTSIGPWRKRSNGPTRAGRWRPKLVGYFHQAVLAAVARPQAPAQVTPMPSAEIQRLLRACVPDPHHAAYSWPVIPLRPTSLPSRPPSSTTSRRPPPPWPTWPTSSTAPVRCVAAGPGGGSAASGGQPGGGALTRLPAGWRPAGDGASRVVLQNSTYSSLGEFRCVEAADLRSRRPGSTPRR